MNRDDTRFAGYLIAGYLAFAEVLSWETSKWPACLVISEYQSADNHSGNQTCATFHEGIMRGAVFLLGFLTHDNVTTAATVVIAVFTLTLWLANEKMWRVTNKAVDLARDDFNATHRPWIALINAELSVGLTWASGTAIIGINIFCKNTGNSPARRVSLIVEIFPLLTYEDVPREMARIQAKHRNSTESRPFVEYTIFPGMRDECLPRVLLIPEGKIADLKDYFGGPAEDMLPVIVGSIEYYFSFGEPVPHYTPFVYHVWLREAQGVAQKAIQLDGKNVEASDMMLVAMIKNAGTQLDA
jgi:hypothetical protein